MPIDLTKLNPEQRAGALHLGGPLLILAGAGTGKTRVITYRIAQLIEAGVPAERILAVTFTNKAAGEMRHRIEELAPGKGALVWAHTFHAFCCRLLRQHHALLKLPKHFTIYDQSDQKKLVVEAMKELGLEEQTNKAGMYVSIISRAKDDMLDAQSYSIYAATAVDAARQTAARIYLSYQKKLDAAGSLDFGDLLLKTCILLKEHQSVREYYQEYFLHTLVDEYQDTNHAQYILTKTLAAKHRNICVVGDDDQCLPPHALIQTPSGPKRIDQIQEGESVIGASGWGKAAPAPVEKVMKRPFKGELLRIRLRSGKVLEATPNHVCFARNVSGDLSTNLARAKFKDGDVLVRSDAVPLTSSGVFQLMPAADLNVGMAVPVDGPDGVIDEAIESIDAVPYEGLVYDLSIPDLRNYSTNGVFVHNSVYSWRGANIRNILEFERDFKDAKVVTLEQNYRSTALILEAAGKVIRHNKSRKLKNLWTEKHAGETIQVQELANEMDEASWVIRRVEDQISSGRSLNEIAIFYRTNAQSRSFEESLRRAGLPYRIVGAMRFYERKEIKDALCYARALLNPADSTSLSRILNVPARGIGKTSIERIEGFAASSGCTLYEAFQRVDAIPNLTSGCRRSVGELVAILEKLRDELPSLSASGAIARILDASGYWAALEVETETDPEAVGRLNNLQELLNAVKEYEGAKGREGQSLDLGSYLEAVSLQSDLDSKEAKEAGITLMTVHLAKGLEYPVVFLTGLEEGLFPIGSASAAPEDLEEERRLAYVGITRAREKLFMTHAATRRIFGQVYANLPSRFILEAQLLNAPPERAMPRQPAASTPGGLGSAATATAAPAARAAFKVGMRVKHPSFGLGAVIDKSGSGEAIKVTVRFDDGRTTKLLVRYAPLEPA